MFVAKRTLLISFLFFLVTGALSEQLFAQNEPIVKDGTSGIQSLPTRIERMHALWQDYQDLELNPDRANLIADQIVQFRHKTGMLSNRSLARAFAMRAWRHLKEGERIAAEKEMNIAASLDPFSREIKSGMAAVKAAGNPLNIFEYFPLYLESIFSSFGTREGQYLLLTDLSLWAGVSLFIFCFAWGLSMLVRYFLPLHHAVMEIISPIVSHDFAALIALMLLGSPLIFGFMLHWLLSAYIALVWAFQTGLEKTISIVTIPLIWMAAGLINMSSSMAVGFTDPYIQAGFSGEFQDSNLSMIRDLENRLKGVGVIREGVVSQGLDSIHKRDLFILANGYRKLGFNAIDGIELINIYETLKGDDSIGMRARVNAANILMERDNIRDAMQEYELALQSPDAKPFALYNLWRLNNILRYTSKANELYNSLASEYPEFIDDYFVDHPDYFPELVDAGLNDQEIDILIQSGLARANGTLEPKMRPVEFFLNFIFSVNAVWMLANLALMGISMIIVALNGRSAVCIRCGKVYCKKCDLDPRSTSTCQACNAISTLKTAIDAELRQMQKSKISRFSKRRWLVGVFSNVLLPGLGNLFHNKIVSGSIIMFIWSFLAGTVYSLDRMPRAESLPFFSHWSIVSAILVIILFLATYPVSLFFSLTSDRKSNDATFRKS